MEITHPPCKRLKTPLALYIVFHPQAGECRELADHLYDWFRLKDDDGEGTEAGLPVWYRTRLKGTRISPEIDWDGAGRNAVICLIDDHMVADADWRTAIERLCEEVSETNGEARRLGPNQVFPVPIDDSAYRLRVILEHRGILPGGPPRPNSEPYAPTTADARLARSDRIRRRARILRRAVTEAVTRELRRKDMRRDPERMSVFVSHAKRDGTPIATAIRDGLADFGQLQAWFDANDLPPGHNFESPMIQAARDQTAALISVVTDAYPTRPWCRTEVNLARTPRPLKLSGSSNDKILAWTVQPSVAVSSNRDRWSRPMAQLAQVPHLGWVEHVPSTKDRIEDVVDRLLLEILLVTYYREYAPAVARYLTQAYPDEHVVLLTWVPDPWSIAQVWHSMPKTGHRWTIAYPGHGLRTTELGELEALVAHLNRHTPGERDCWRLLSQERLLQAPNIRPKAAIRVALSHGGQPDDVEFAGVGVKIIDDLIVRITRRLLEAHIPVLFGGRLAVGTPRLADSLIEVAVGWDAHAHDAVSTRSASVSEDVPTVNYIAWPYHRRVSVRQQAELARICHFELVVPTEGSARNLPAPEAFDPNNVEHMRYAADSLTQMRGQMTEDSDARLILGGKISRFSGWLPSILEEVSSALEKGRLPMIIGGFGGCAQLLAEFLSSEDKRWPEVLTFNYARDSDPKYRELTDATDWARPAEIKYTTAQTRLEAYRNQLHGPEDQWPTAWSSRQAVLRLLSTQSFGPAIRLILEILKDLPSARTTTDA